MQSDSPPPTESRPDPDPVLQGALDALDHLCWSLALRARMRASEGSPIEVVATIALLAPTLEAGRALPPAWWTDPWVDVLLGLGIRAAIWEGFASGFRGRRSLGTPGATSAPASGPVRWSADDDRALRAAIDTVIEAVIEQLRDAIEPLTDAK